jgi:hypothetical protein
VAAVGEFWNLRVLQDGGFPDRISEQLVTWLVDKSRLCIAVACGLSRAPSAMMTDETAGQFFQISQLWLKEREEKKSPVFLRKFLVPFTGLFVCKHKFFPYLIEVIL